MHKFNFWKRKKIKLIQLTVSSGFFSCHKSNGVSDQKVKYFTYFVLTVIKGRVFYRNIQMLLKSA